MTYRTSIGRNEKKTGWRSSRLRVERLEVRTLLSAAPLISELMAANDETLSDWDGDSSDWVEIYNPGPAALDLNGWHLTDDPDELGKWEFPAVSIGANDYLLVFASGKDRSVAGAELHTNFQLDGDGEYMALVEPNGLTVAHEYAPQFPEQYEDISYGIYSDPSDFILPGDENITYSVPTDGSLGTSWTGTSFNDSAWTDVGDESPSVLITEAGTGAPDYFEVQNVSSASVNTTGWVVAANNASGAQDINNVHSPLWDFPGALTPGEIRYRPDVVGDNIYWLDHDHGWVMIVDNAGQVIDFVVWGYTDQEVAALNIDVGSFQDITLQSAWLGPAVVGQGAPSVAVQRIGNSDNNDASDWTFANPPTGNFLNEGLIVPFVSNVVGGIGFDTTGTGVGQAVGTNIAADMQGSNASAYVRIPFELSQPTRLTDLQLSIRYNDGFVAYINGQEVARQGAPESLQWDSAATAARDAAESLQVEVIDLSDYRDVLQAGNNVLAIHGLNVSAGDGDFLIYPQLSGKSVQYFSPATPEEPNGPGELGRAEKLRFSRTGGVFDASFAVALSADAPQATIYYTLNDSLPTESSLLYTGPITISNSTRIRARAFEPNKYPGPVVSASYLKLAADLEGFDSNLPIVIVDTFGDAIPGTTSTNYATTYSVFIDTDATGRAAITDPIDFTGRGGLRIRGRSSTQWPKKQYKFETWNEADDDKNVSILGMPSESDWVLQAPYSDKTLMRNHVSYRWWEGLGHYSVGTQFVEVFLNSDGDGQISYADDYVGIYVFMESISVDDDRVDITKLGPNDNAEPEVTGGYIIEMGNPNPGGFATTTSGQRVEFSYWDPKFGELTTEQKAWARGYINQFEAALYGPNFDDPDTGYAQYTDVDSQIDYEIMRELTRNFDGGSTFFTIDRGGKLTMGPLWDYNMALGNANYAEGDIPGYRTDGWNLSYMTAGVNAWSPWWHRFDDDPDYQQKFIDRWTELRQDTLSTETLQADIDEAYTLLDSEAAARNFARWPVLGTYVWANPDGWNTRTTYLSEVDWMRDWITDRGDWIDSQFVGRVEFNQNGGFIDPGFQLTMTAPSGTIYYTLDGSDPRAPGGGISGTSYAGPITLNENTMVTARALSGGKWSGVHRALFSTIFLADADNFAITELNYNPHDPTPDETLAGFLNNDDFEFLELQNTGIAPITLTNVRFTEGIDFDFTGSGVETLLPGQYVVLAQNPAAFVQRYGAVSNLVGPYTGRLANGGEQLAVIGALGETIRDFTYGDSGDAGWPDRADGTGASLEIIDPAGDSGDPINWRSSSEYLGTPGSTGAGPYQGIVVNEVLTHTDAPLVDGIELYNPTDTAVDLDGWWLSDSSGDFFQFQIPANTTIPAYGYVMFYEGHYEGQTFAVDQQNEFGGSGAKDFALDGARGDDVWLLIDPGDGSSLRFADHVEFGGALNGESFGRWPDAAGSLYPMLIPTLGYPNNGPRPPGEIAISEVMYNPPGGDIPDHLEFIEVYNFTAQPVDLTGWRLRKGFDYDFVPGTILDGQSAMVIVSFDPNDPAKLDAFRTTYGLGPEVVIVGNPNDTLSDTGERIQLQRPDTPPPNDPLYVPHVIEDEIDYLNTWHATTDGLGNSLNRWSRMAWGNDAASWLAASPTPGEVASLESAGVAGRYVFYDNSAYDNQAKGLSNANAIAPDKTALQPNGQAGFANYTTYVRGINGIIIDAFGLTDSGALGPSDFTFKLGNDDTPANWPDAPTPSIDVSPGPGGSERILLTWDDNAIRNTWLEVTVLVTSNTGLPTADVFYFGNLVGECTGDGRVDPVDVLETRSNPRPFFDPALTDTVHDFNRDRRVDAIDTLIARNNQTWSATELQLLDLTSSKAAKSNGAVGSTSRTTGHIYDTILQQVSGREAKGPEPDSVKVDWLYELDLDHAHKRRSDDHSRAQRALDKLMADSP